MTYILNEGSFKVDVIEIVANFVCRLRSIIHWVGDFLRSRRQTYQNVDFLVNCARNRYTVSTYK